MKTIALFVSALVLAYGASPGYKFTILAQTGDTIAGKTLTSVGYPLINNTGTLVFSSSFAGGSGIFTPTDSLVKTGDTISGKKLTSIGEFRFNDTGTLVFRADFAAGSGIFTPAQVSVQTGDTVGGAEISSLGGLALNNAGTVVFIANGGRSILTPYELLFQVRPYGEPWTVYSPAINDAGMVVFAGAADPEEYPIYTLSGVLAVGPPDVGYDSPVINNSGTVVFFSEYGFAGPARTAIRSTSGEVAVASSDFGSNSSVIGGRTLSGIRPPPAINDAGIVVFGAIHWLPKPPPLLSASGLFTTSELLIEDGDTIGGKTMAFTIDFAPSINDAGAIAFHAEFADGTSGIVIATPVVSGVGGDINGDGVVNCADLDVIKADLGKSHGQAGFNPRADVDGDGIIDSRDLAFVAQHISAGVSCPP